MGDGDRDWQVAMVERRVGHKGVCVWKHKGASPSNNWHPARE